MTKMRIADLRKGSRLLWSMVLLTTKWEKNMHGCKLNQLCKPRVYGEFKVYSRISKTSEVIKRKAWSSQRHQVMSHSQKEKSWECCFARVLVLAGAVEIARSLCCISPAFWKKRKVCYSSAQFQKFWGKWSRFMRKVGLGHSKVEFSLLAGAERLI